MSEFSHTQVDFLRHGACEGGDIFRGSTDVALSDQGWQQMQDSVRSLIVLHQQGEHADKPCWDQIVVSPLRRCREFAGQLADSMNIPVRIDSDFQEISFGDWEGRRRSQVWAEQPEVAAAFFANPAAVTPQGGETYVALTERLNRGWQRLLKENRDKRVLLIHHGGTIRTLFCLLEEKPSSRFGSIEVPFACVSRWRVYSDDGVDSPILSFHNYQGTSRPKVNYTNAG